MFISKSNIKSFSLLLAVFVLLSWIGLSGCFLAPPTGNISTRPSTQIGEDIPFGSWGASAFPGYACPADNITLEWNAGNPLCPAGTGPSCQELSVTDNVGLLTPPFTSRDLIGTHVNGSISGLSGWSGANPEFTLSVVHDDPADPGWVNATSEVEIVQNPPAVAITRNFKVVSALCDGNLGWSLTQYRLDMASEDFLKATRGFGGCVRITSVCYLPNDPQAKRPSPIIVSLVGGGPMTATTLSLGECRDGLNLKTDLAYDVQPAPSATVFPRQEGSCVEGMTDNPITDPPFTQLLFTFGCDTTSEECMN